MAQQFLVKGFFTEGQLIGVSGVIAFNDGLPVMLFLDPDSLLDRHADQRTGKDLTVKTHVQHISRGCRGQTLWRFKTRNDGARPRVTSHPEPCQQKVH